MKARRELNKIATFELRNFFNQHFDTNRLTNSVMDLLSESKQRKFIIDTIIDECEESWLIDEIKSSVWVLK